MASSFVDSHMCHHSEKMNHESCHNIHSPNLCHAVTFFFHWVLLSNFPRSRINSLDELPRLQNCCCPDQTFTRHIHLELCTWVKSTPACQIWATWTTYNSHIVRANRMNQRFPKSVPQLIFIQVGWIWTRHVAMLWSAWGSDLANMIKSPKCHHSTSHGGQMRVPAPVFCALGFRPAEKQAFECVYFPKK